MHTKVIDRTWRGRTIAYAIQAWIGRQAVRIHRIRVEGAVHRLVLSIASRSSCARATRAVGGLVFKSVGLAGSACTIAAPRARTAALRSLGANGTGGTRQLGLVVDRTVTPILIYAAHRRIARLRWAATARSHEKIQNVVPKLRAHARQRNQKQQERQLAPHGIAIALGARPLNRRCVWHGIGYGYEALRRLVRLVRLIFKIQARRHPIG